VDDLVELAVAAAVESVADYLKRNKPVPRHSRNYHQWMNENFGLPSLMQHMKELRDKVDYHYK
jgi:hypothetical protein